MRKVIAHALFGERLNYRKSLGALIRAERTLFPDWEIRIYHDDLLYRYYYGASLLRMNEKGIINLIFQGSTPPMCRAMLWRLLPCWDLDVEWVLCRDLDHMSSPRERKLVQAFIDSNATIHAISDHELHTAPMMGGLIGFNGPRFRVKIGGQSLETLISQAGIPDKDWYDRGADQLFAFKVLWPLFHKETYEHRLSSFRTSAETFKLETIVPNIAIKDVPEKILQEGDRLVSVMGTGKFIAEEVITFYSQNGNPSSMQRIKEAEIYCKEPSTKPCFETPETCPSISKRRVIYSSNENHDYFFYLPLTTLLWKELVNYDPIVLLTGTPKEWLDIPKRKLALEKTKQFGGDVYFLGNIQNVRSSTLAQVSRLYAGGLVLADDVYVLTSDVDMWPLQKNYFYQQDFQKKLHLYYANAYAPKIKYPICYMGAYVKVWREIMGLGNPYLGDDTLYFQKKTQYTIMNSLLTDCITKNLPSTASAWENWLFDEELFGKVLQKWPGFPTQCQMIHRNGGPPEGRVDRAGWQFDSLLPTHIDAHLVRPGYSGDNWVKIDKLLKALLDEVNYQKAIEYRGQFISR